MPTIKLKEAGINLVIDITEGEKGGNVRLLHFSPLPYQPALIKDDNHARWYRLVDIHVSGANQHDHHGSKYSATSPGMQLKYKSHADTRNAQGRKLEIVQTSDSGLLVTSHLQFHKSIPMVTCWTTLQNISATPIPIDYVSSFVLTGLTKESPDAPWDAVSRVHLPHNYWDGEVQWRSHSLPELGMSRVAHASTKRISIDVRGTWGSDGYLPMAAYENTATGTTLFWQIEHHGSWHWEISDHQNGQLYLAVSGPTFNESHWTINLQPGATFDSIPVAAGHVKGSFETAMQQLTRYRRATRRLNDDNKKLPVIFNDYMNCLFGDPTTAKLIPLIDAAAKAGCEYFCIDCGWYADGHWWDGVGQWLPSAKRFPGPAGIKEPLDHIRKRGMVPGLWLELEVMGIHCPMVKEVSKDWFFQRNGQPLIDHGRYQLDYRNPQVIAHANAVIERLVNDYGVGYIKMDYNINAGVGTSLNSDSLGDGLLQHQRAYLAWLDSIFAQYPNLVIENCGSGGLRMTHSLLKRHSIQSSSDQTDYRKYAPIAAASPTAVTPEQSAVWSYPLRDGNPEETIFNMVNAMLLRIHQSGHLAELSPERLALVTEGIATYKKIRKHIATGLPFWPLGTPTLTDGWVSYGITNGQTDYLAVWRLGGSPKKTLPIAHRKGTARKPKIIYPQNRKGAVAWDRRSATLTATLPEKYTARLIQL